MKKYRPYEKIPSTIIGRIIELKDGSGAFQVKMIRDGNVSLHGMIGEIASEVLFKYYIFPDGTPVGEEYEEAVNLVHDKVYCVRMYGENWDARHYACSPSGVPLFFYNGCSSLTSNDGFYTSWCYVSEYDEDLLGTTDEPKNGYLYHRE